MTLHNYISPFSFFFIDKIVKRRLWKKNLVEPWIVKNISATLVHYGRAGNLCREPPRSAQTRGGDSGYLPHYSQSNKKNRLTRIESHQTDQIYSEKQLWFHSLSLRDQMVCELVSHNEWEWRLGKSILYHTRFNYFWMWLCLCTEYRLQSFKRDEKLVGRSCPHVRSGVE